MNDSKLTNGQITKYSMMGLTQFMAMMPAFMYYRTFLQVNLKVPSLRNRKSFRDTGSKLRRIKR